MDESTVEGRTDTATMRRECVSFIRSTVLRAGADGVVIGLSGDLGSTTAAALAVEALDRERVSALVLPASKIGSRSAQDAEAVADVLGIDAETVHLQPLLLSFGEIAPHTDLHGDPIVRENLVDRIRMTMLYLAANATDRLVVGTATKSERLLGSVTKHGDGAADLFPLGGRYRTEVERLADDLGVPDFVTDSPAAVGFYPGRLDARDLGVPQSTIDAVLRLLTETDAGIESIADALDVGVDSVEAIARRRDTTRHKRRLSPTPST